MLSKSYPLICMFQSENEPIRFCFLLILWPPAKVKTADSGIRRLRSMVPTSMAGTKEYGRKVCILQSFAKQDGWTNTTNCTERLITHMDKQEEQMLRQSIFATVTGLLWSCVPYIINHCKSLDNFKPLHNRTITQFLAFLSPCDTQWRSRSFKLIPNFTAHQHLSYPVWKKKNKPCFTSI